MRGSDYVMVARVLRSAAKKIEKSEENGQIKAVRTSFLLDIATGLAREMERESTKFSKDQFFDRIYKEDDDAYDAQELD